MAAAPFGNQAGVAPQQIGVREAAGRVETGFLNSWAELNLTILVLVFALASLLLFFWLAKTGKFDQFMMRLYVIIILVFGTLLVVSSAYGTEQITPVVGFFGTIAGYLLGRGDRQNGPNQ